MSQIYEAMFVLDNQVVREDWKTAKELVTGTLEKHGGTVHTARRWDERRLAYPIKGRRRGTYLLAYYEIPTEAIPTMRRDFDLSERVLRYLFTSVDGVPAEETALAEAENAADFTVPTPPDDDAPEPEEVVEEDPRDRRRPRPDADAKATEGAPAEGESAPEETKSDEPATAEAAPAETATAEPKSDATPEPAAAPAETTEAGVAEPQAVAEPEGSKEG